MEGGAVLSKKRRKRRRRVNWGAFCLLFLLIAVIAAGIYGIVRVLTDPDDHISSNSQSGFQDSQSQPVVLTKSTIEPTLNPPPSVSYPSTEGPILQLTSGIESSHAVLIDLDNNTVIAEKGSQEIIYPASMTKLMTLIVAIEHIEDLNATFLMTDEILAPLYAQNASMAGFQSGEECTMLDLLYGAALPSGADATTALALHTAGSEETFVQWMNEKVEELQLQNTHFTNASGLHDLKHYSTVTDIALILEYCMQNELCKKIISTYTYTTRVTSQSPEGIQLFSTMFSRMYGTEVEGISILGGKTGFTDEAGNCLASYAQTPDGKTYVAVTAGGITRWKPVFDAFRIYGVITGTYPMNTPDAHEEETETA